MATHWFCGHCNFGPMMIETVEHCVICYRQRDSYATYENLGPSFTASLNQPEPRSSVNQCGNRGLIAYQQTASEPGAGGLPVQEKALVPMRCYCCHDGDGPGYINTEMRRLSCDLENCRENSQAP